MKDFVCVFNIFFGLCHDFHSLQFSEKCAFSYISDNEMIMICVLDY
jgi:hypothetical protein